MSPRPEAPVLPRGPPRARPGDVAQEEGGTAHVERVLRRGPLGPCLLALALASPASTCVSPQEAWEWLLQSVFSILALSHSLS